MSKISKKRPSRRPSHPGAILKRVWLDELGWTQTEFAEKLVSASAKNITKGTMQTKLNELINGKRAMSAEFAVLIGRVLKTSPRMWMGLQMNLDIWDAEESSDVA